VDQVPGQSDKGQHAPWENRQRFGFLGSGTTGSQEDTRGNTDGTPTVVAAEESSLEPKAPLQHTEKDTTIPAESCEASMVQRMQEGGHPNAGLTPAGDS
jgi:hypothetical protein